MTNKKRYREQFAAAMREQGCYVRPAHGGGYFIILPNRQRTILPGSPSDRRWLKNLRADIERAGLEFPEIGKNLT